MCKSNYKQPRAALCSKALVSWLYLLQETNSPYKRKACSCWHFPPEPEQLNTRESDSKTQNISQVSASAAALGEPHHWDLPHSKQSSVLRNGLMQAAAVNDKRSWKHPKKDLQLVAAACGF